MDRVSPPFFVVPWPGLVGPAFGSLKIEDLGTLGCWLWCIVLSGRQDRPSAHPRYGNIRARLRRKASSYRRPARVRSSQYAPRSRGAVKVLCPAGHGETPGQQVFWGRSDSLVPWLHPQRVRRFDLGGSPNRQSWRLLPCRLPHRAAEQKTARILDMNGGEPLFFKVRKWGRGFLPSISGSGRGHLWGYIEKFFENLRKTSEKWILI